MLVIYGDLSPHSFLFYACIFAEGQVLPTSQGLTLYFCFLMGPPSKESLSLLYKSFLQPLLTYSSPGWFPFLSTTNFTKLKCLHRAASRAITSCLLSSPIPLLLSEASLHPLRVTLTHFTLFSYERALCL